MWECTKWKNFLTRLHLIIILISSLEQFMLEMTSISCLECRGCGLSGSQIEGNYSNRRLASSWTERIFFIFILTTGKIQPLQKLRTETPGLTFYPKDIQGYYHLVVSHVPNKAAINYQFHCLGKVNFSSLESGVRHCLCTL